MSQCVDRNAGNEDFQHEVMARGSLSVNRERTGGLRTPGEVDRMGYLEAAVLLSKA